MSNAYSNAHRTQNTRKLQHDESTVVKNISTARSERYTISNEICYQQRDMLSTAKDVFSREICYRQRDILLTANMFSTAIYVIDREICYQQRDMLIKGSEICYLERNMLSTARYVMQCTTW